MKKSVMILLIVIMFVFSISAINAQETNGPQATDSGAEIAAVSSTNQQEMAAGSPESASEGLNVATGEGAYLVVDNDADKENIHIGDYVTWVVEASNYGPNVAKNVKVFDELPDGLEYVKYTATKGVFNPVTGIWEIGDLTPEEGIVTLFITTKALTLGEKINKVFITSDTPNLNDNDHEDEEIDVESDDDSDSSDFSKHVNAKVGLYEGGNPIFLFLIALLMLFVPVIRR